MTEATTRHKPGTPCWASLLVHDLTVGQKFYGELFGWEFREAAQPVGLYVRAHFGDLEIAGLGEVHHGLSLPVTWLPYLATDDADRTCAVIRERGGTVGVGPLDSEHTGRMAIASDPSGAAFGVWQAIAPLGAAPDGRLGTPVWDELVTRDAAAAARFYRSVFDYEVAPVETSGGDYLTLELDGRPVGGIRGVGDALPRDRGPHWTTYFAVADTDAAAARVRQLGGAVLREPRDSPYGRLAQVTDPEGAPFAVIRLDDPRDAIDRPLRTP